MAVQVLAVYTVHHKKSRKNLFIEIAIVVLCVKPAIDAARVAGGKEQQLDET